MFELAAVAWRGNHAIPRDTSYARSLMYLSTQLENPDALACLGLIFCCEERTSEGLAMLQQAAKLGHRQAAWILLSSTMTGAEGRSWIEKLLHTRPCHSVALENIATKYMARKRQRDLVRVLLCGALLVQ